MSGTDRKDWSLVELERMAQALSPERKLATAERSLTLNEFTRMLRANAERDEALVSAASRIDRLETLCEHLEVDRDAVRSEISHLKRDYLALLARQDTLAAAVDVFADRVSKIARESQALADSVTDVTEP